MSSTERLASEHLVADLVEDEILEPEHVAGQVAGRAAEDRLDPRDDLGEAERLGDVVVAAGAERLDLVLGRVLRGQEEHGALAPERAQPAADLDPLDVGEHPVEHDQVGLDARDRGERVAAAVDLLDLVPLVAKRGRDGVDDRLLVVDDEDPVPVRSRTHALTVTDLPVSCLRIGWEKTT